MSIDDSATRPISPALPTEWAGMLWGALGVTAFSFTMPFTRVAVAGLPPWFIATGRAVVAGVLACLALWLTRQPIPARRLWGRLAVVGLGVVIGFPLFSSLALQHVPASHGAVVVAILPAATAALAVLRGHERPPWAFWLAAIAGAAAALVLASTGPDGLGRPGLADLYLLAAVVLCAIGYAEGGLLARELGAWQTVSWALVGCLPLMVVATGLTVAAQPVSASPVQWAAFGYLGLVSMFLGFFAWYRGLAIGPMARVSQVQLIQPVLSVAWAWLLLGEQITLTTIVGGLAVLAFAALAVRIRVARPATANPVGRPVATNRV